MGRATVLRCPTCGGDNIHPAGHARGKPRYSCGVKNNARGGACAGGCGWHGTEPIGWEKAASEGVDQALSKRLARKMRASKGIRRYVITSAQNATPVNAPFLNALTNYCLENEAELIVIPYRYRNPTSRWSRMAQEDDWWASEITPFLMDQRVDLHKHLVLLADIKTQPTATSPLEGFETIAGPKSAIIGHPKLELLTVATPQQRMPKILTTTGAITQANYIPSKAGKKGEFHHTFGALVVELDGKYFHLRHINAMKDGSFCDLDYEYYPDREREMQRAEGLVMGDTHVDFADPSVVKATFGDGGVVSLLNPKALVWHDVFDCYSGSHHHRHKPLTKYVKHHAKRNNVHDELQRCVKFMATHGAGRANIIVESNHNRHLTRWVEETDPRQDPENCVFWAATYAVMCESAQMGAGGAQHIDPFAYWAQKGLVGMDFAFLGPDESYQISGIEVGMHGDRGPNGSRGAIKAFGKIGAKSVIGHSHSPGIKDGVYQVGTSSLLRLEYNAGPSSWLHTHCVIYKNGKRALINIIDGRFKA